VINCDAKEDGVIQVVGVLCLQDAARPAFAAPLLLLSSRNAAKSGGAAGNAACDGATIRVVSLGSGDEEGPRLLLLLSIGSLDRNVVACAHLDRLSARSGRAGRLFGRPAAQVRALPRGKHVRLVVGEERPLLALAQDDQPTDDDSDAHAVEQQHVARLTPQAYS